MRVSAMTSLFVLPLVLVASRALAAPASAAAPHFERLKALAGTWESADADSDGKPDQTVVYRVTAAGHAVEETLFPGTPKEMLTLYTLDQDDLVLTHYCTLGNQPHMKAAADSDAKHIAFAFVSAGNLDSRDTIHMDALVLTFTDATHLKHVWSLYAKGAVVQDAVFEFTKKP